MEPIRALEFFSGIGGLHFGFLASGAVGEVLASFDMNEQANASYEKSFSKKPVSRGIDKLTLKDLEKYKANCWLMSPPCQPYTRGGKLLDDKDNRAKPLLHMLDLLEKIGVDQLPTFIFLENVKNFEVSRSRDRMVRLLRKRGYVFRECLVAPYNFGVPNDRLRYFLMARLRSSFKGQQQTTTATTSDPASSLLPFDPEREPIYTTWPFPAFVEDPCLVIEPFHWEIPQIQDFLDADPEAGKPYLLPRKLILDRPNFRFDILRPSSTRSSCFTKAYGSHHVKSGGGLLQTVDQGEGQEGYDFADSEAIANLGLRFFSPSEVARLHAFPLKEEGSREKEEEEEEEEEAKDAEDSNRNQQRQQQQQQEQQRQQCFTVQGTRTSLRRFTLGVTQNGKHTLEFPAAMTAIQRFRLLGNSLNVWVVAELLRGILFAEHGDDDDQQQALPPTEQRSCAKAEPLPETDPVLNSISNNNNSEDRHTDDMRVSSKHDHDGDEGVLAEGGSEEEDMKRLLREPKRRKDSSSE
ncbi:tRNA (cytosine-5-)-methyltransferase [Actinomortierella ambigua]|nr:tRNA (cytosine-5-)-methyltransferase [Actinomortierella ambigua]